MLLIQLSKYRKVLSSRLSWLVARIRIFRRLMKGKFDAYVLWPLAKKFQNRIVDPSTARHFNESSNVLHLYRWYFVRSLSYEFIIWFLDFQTLNFRNFRLLFALLQKELYVKDAFYSTVKFRRKNEISYCCKQKTGLLFNFEPFGPRVKIHI